MMSAVLRVAREGLWEGTATKAREGQTARWGLPSQGDGCARARRQERLAH